MTWPADIEIERVYVDPSGAVCYHGWSVWGIPQCARCIEDRRQRERFSEAMRRGRPPREYIVHLVRPESA